MAISDGFILLDDVQFEKGSFMNRNRILNTRGEIEYLTISADKHGYLEKKYREILITNEKQWKAKHLTQLENSYKESSHYSEVMDLITPLYKRPCETLCEFVISSVQLMKDTLEISTPIYLQSEMEPIDGKKTNLVVELCRQLNADCYLSGTGAKKYTEEDVFTSAGIALQYQKYTAPKYEQLNTDEFVPGLSILDVLCNCGIEKTRQLFYSSLHEQ